MSEEVLQPRVRGGRVTRHEAARQLCASRRPWGGGLRRSRAEQRSQRVRGNLPANLQNWPWV